MHLFNDTIDTFLIISYIYDRSFFLWKKVHQQGLILYWLHIKAMAVAMWNSVFDKMYSTGK